MMLEMATGMVTFQFALICAKSSSKPRKNMKKISPRLAISEKICRLDCGQIASDQPGA